MKREESPQIPDTIYAKSNVLISAKYRSTLTENKIMALALSDQNRMKADAGGTIRVKIPASEIREAIGGNKGSFYNTLKETAKDMNNRQIGLINEANGQFAFFQIIQSCIYADGELNITFNSDLSKYIKNLRDNFTKLKLPEMLSFKSEYSFRLYELLKSRAYNKDKNDTNNEWIINYQLAELQLQLGVVDMQDKKAKSVLNFDENPDYEKAVEVAVEKKQSLTEWSTFKKTVLNKAVKEINEKTEMIVEYIPKKGGQGGKVKGVQFVITTKLKDTGRTKKEKEAKALTSEQMKDFLDEVFDIIEERIKISEAEKIAEASEWNIEKIIEKYELAKKQKNIENLVGWMVSALKDDYSEPVKKKGGKSATNNDFSNFDQRKYDYDELIKDIVN